jgi:hypothetical protein
MFPPYPAPPRAPYGRGMPRGQRGELSLRYPPLLYGTQFDGVNDYGESTTLALPAPTEFTVMGWAVFTTFASVRAAFSTLTSGQNGFRIITAGSSSLRFDSIGPTGTSTLLSGPSIALNRRYHLCLRVSGGNMAAYLDGAQVAQVAVPAGNRPSAITRLTLGSEASGGSPFQGRLAAWIAFQRALSDAEIFSAAATPGMPSLPLDVVAIYPLEQIGPAAAQSPDTSGLGRHLTLVNMVPNPIVTL